MAGTNQEKTSSVTYRTVWCKDMNEFGEVTEPLTHWLFKETNDLAHHIAVGGLDHLEDLNVSFVYRDFGAKKSLFIVTFNIEDGVRVLPLLEQMGE